jgi:hypothetical protein
MRFWDFLAILLIVVLLQPKVVGGAIHTFWLAMQGIY